MEGETPAFRLRTGWEACRFSFTQGEQFPMFLNFVPDMSLTSDGLWYDGPQGNGLRSSPPPACCAAERRRFLKTHEKPTGDVRPPPRARNQAREPRRHAKRAPAPTQAPAQDTRGNRDPLPVGEGETMTATDPQPATMLADGGAPPRRPHKARAQRPGRRFTPPASSRTARSADPGPQAAWPRPREAAACPRTGRGDRQPDGFMPEPTTAYEPCACRT